MSVTGFDPEDPTGLEELNEQCRRDGIDYAVKRARYYRLKNQRALECKASGMPVTLISEVLKGYPEVNEAMCEMDCAEVVYKASLDAHIDRRQQVRARNEQLAREYYS